MLSIRDKFRSPSWAVAWLLGIPGLIAGLFLASWLIRGDAKWPLHDPWRCVYAVLVYTIFWVVFGRKMWQNLKHQQRR